MVTTFIGGLVAFIALDVCEGFSPDNSAVFFPWVFFRDIERIPPFLFF
jgi:hypothetical protein